MASTHMWMKFFLEAGIPKESSVQYAISFDQNRMDMNMLMDLDKEYLRDLKITALGDIISILKHAKVQHERLSSDRVLNPECGNISPTDIGERSESKLKDKTPQEPNCFSTGAKTRPTSASVRDEDTGQNIHKRLGPLVVKVKEEASSSVFSRLGDQEEEEEMKMASPAEKITMADYLEDAKSSSSRTSTTPKTGSIFGRLGPETKESKPQESHVSSSSDPLSHGILKTKKVGIGKTKSLTSLGLSTKSLSIAKRLGTQTNIISLRKPPTKEMERKRVSFGENEVKNMSTGIVSSMAEDVRPKSPANIVDLRTKLDHENKLTKVAPRITTLKASPSSNLPNLMIRSRPSPITAPASTTSGPAKPARIKLPVETSATSGGVKARIGAVTKSTERIKAPPVAKQSPRITPIIPPAASRVTIGAARATPAAREPTPRTPVTPPGAPVRTAVAPSGAPVRTAVTPSGAPVRTAVAPSGAPVRTTVTPSGAPVRTTVHLNPKMIKLQTSTTASKTSVKSRIGEKDLEVKMTGDRLKRSVARPPSPARTTVKRTMNREEELVKEEMEKEEIGAKPKKKRLVMIKTKADGTKTRHVISENDPILQKVTVTKIRKTASASSIIPSSYRKSFHQVEDTRRPKSEEDIEPHKDDYKMKVRPITSSSHQTLAGKAMELAVRDEKRAFQGGGFGDKAFLTLASRAKAASLSRSESFEEEADLIPRRDSDHRIRQMSWDEERSRMPLEEEIIRTPMEEGRSRRMSVEERLSIEEERMRKITMEEEKLRQKLAEHNERTRRLAEVEERERRKSVEEERSRRIPVEDTRYQVEDVGRGRVFQRLGGKQRY